MTKSLYIAVILTGIVLFVAALKAGEAFIVPLACGVFLSYALSPAVAFLEKMKLPRVVGASLSMIAFLTEMSFLGSTIWHQGLAMLDTLPHALEQVSKNFREFKADRNSTIAKIEAAKAAVEVAITTPAESTTGQTTPKQERPASSTSSAKVPAPPTRKEVATPAPISRPDSLASFALKSTSTAFSMLGTIATVCLLAMFLMTSKELMRKKAVRLFEGRFSDGRFTEKVLNEIDRAIQRYLASLMATNVLLGVLTFLALWLMGLNDAMVWGILAGIFHFVPFLGPLATASGIFLSGLGQWESMGQPMLAAATSIVIAFIVGNFVQTWAMGKVAQMNAVAVFVSLLFFAWLWGSIGLLIAVPVMVVVKVVCDHQPALRPMGDLLGE